MVKKFVYQLGAGRFDEYLAAEVEESMRNFINTIWLNQVLDLKSDMANNMMSELNRPFDGKFGIRFEQCNVTNVASRRLKHLRSAKWPALTCMPSTLAARLARKEYTLLCRK